jgi:hypothetical protein
MSEGTRGYVSYLLRLWQARTGGQWIWRASLESTRGGERQGFASLEALFAYLRKQARVPPDLGENHDKGLEER